LLKLTTRQYKKLETSSLLGHSASIPDISSTNTAKKVTSMIGSMYQVIQCMAF